MLIIEKVMLALCLFSIGYIFLQWVSLLVHLKFSSRLRRRALTSTYRPFVSILKPVRGIDAGGYENFKSFCRLDYPNYELIFGVAEENDPVIGQIKMLQKEFPHIPIQVALSSREIGPNPKVNNLANAYELSRGDVIVMSDSDVRVEPDYLQHAVTPLEDRKVGLVTAVVMASGAKDFWSHLHALLVNGSIGSIFSIMYQAGLLDMGYGPSIAMRREVLQEIGGLQALANYVGEDIHFGKLVKKAGYRVSLQSKIVRVFKEYSSWPKQHDLTLRWVIVVERQSRVFTIIIPVFFAIQMTLLNLILFRNTTALLLLGVALTARAIFMITMTLLFLKEPKLLRYMWAASWGELGFAYVWIKSIYTNRICWRGRWYRVLPGGCMEHCEGVDDEDVALLGA